MEETTVERMMSKYLDRNGGGKASRADLLEALRKEECEEVNAAYKTLCHVFEVFYGRLRDIEENHDIQDGDELYIAMRHYIKAEDIKSLQMRAGLVEQRVNRILGIIGRCEIR